MSENYFLLKIMLYGFFGYYFLYYIDCRDKKYSEGFYSLFYALFSLAALTSRSGNIVYLALSGAIFAIILKTFLSCVDRNLIPQVHFLWFGLANVLNYYLLNRVFAVFIENSHPSSALFLLFIGLAAIFIDLSLTLRIAQKSN